MNESLAVISHYIRVDNNEAYINKLIKTIKLFQANTSLANEYEQFSEIINLYWQL